MTAASVAALTVYDMVKGVERGVEIRVAPARLEDRRQERRVAPAGADRRTAPPKPRRKPGERMAGGSAAEAQSADERAAREPGATARRSC